MLRFFSLPPAPGWVEVVAVTCGAERSEGVTVFKLFSNFLLFVDDVAMENCKPH